MKIYKITEASEYLGISIKKETGNVLEDLYENTSKKYTYYPLFIGKNSSGLWFVSYEQNAINEGLHQEINITEADARAKMLIYLLENNILEQSVK